MFILNKRLYLTVQEELFGVFMDAPFDCTNCIFFFLLPHLHSLLIYVNKYNDHSLWPAHTLGVCSNSLALNLFASNIHSM